MWAKVRPKLAEYNHSLPTLGRETWPRLARIRSKWVPSRPAAGPNEPNVFGILAKLAQSDQDMAQHGPHAPHPPHGPQGPQGPPFHGLHPAPMAPTAPTRPNSPHTAPMHSPHGPQGPPQPPRPPWPPQHGPATRTARPRPARGPPTARPAADARGNSSTDTFRTFVRQLLGNYGARRKIKQEMREEGKARRESGNQQEQKQRRKSVSSI